MPVVIDGNNLLHGMKDASNRDDVRKNALDKVRNRGVDLTVVFDGPPPNGRPDVEHLGLVTVRYSGRRSADEVIVNLLPGGGGAAGWVVVTDDRALRDQILRRGGRVRSLGEWQRRGSGRRARPVRESKLSSNELADWEAYFASEDHDRD